jgi:hypothetical protein
MYTQKYEVFICYQNLRNVFVLPSGLLYEVKKTGNVRINVTLRHVRATIIAVEKQLVLPILSVCL